MKVAISLPDALFNAAEHIAEEMQLSRSQLYARALAEFLERRDNSSVTAQLNAVYSDQHSPMDPTLELLGLEVLRNEAW